MARFIRFPWATSGDRAEVPFAVDPGGAVSYSQGFGPDYEITPGDPGWKPVPRDETNGFYYDITDNIRQYQIAGVPDWHPAADNAGIAISYPINASVRWNDVVWRSLIANNTVEPGTDATKWTVDDAFSVAATEASLAETLAASIGTKFVTPRRLGPAVQRGVWNYATAGGTANALTVTLSPVPAALTAGLLVRFVVANDSTAPATLNVNGLGAAPIVPFVKMVTGQIFDVVYDGANWQIVAANALNISKANLTRAASIRSDVSPVSVPNDFIQILPITSSSDDGQGDFTVVSNTLVCQRAGRYQLSANFGGGLTGGATATALTFGLLLNSSQFASSTIRLSSSIVSQVSGGAADVVDLAVNDVLSFWAFQSSGATRNLFLTNRVALQRLTV